MHRLLRPAQALRNRAVVISAALAAIVTTSAPSVAALPVFGGPTYVRATGGYMNPDTRMSSAIRGDLSLHGAGFYGQTVGNNGTAVGYASLWTSSTSRKGDAGVRWTSADNSAVALGSLPGNGHDPYGYAFAVNNSGTAVGYSWVFNASGQQLGEQAIRWSPDATTPTKLGNLGTFTNGSFYSRAYAINDAGTAAGFAEKRDTAGNWYGYRAVRWNAGGTIAQELGTLGVSPTGTPYTNAEAFDINASGTAVGYATKWFNSTSSGSRAVRWDAGGTVATELGYIGARSETTAVALKVNDAGTAVGWGLKFNENGVNLGERAIRWDAGGTTATELGNLGTAPDGTTTTWAAGINDAGTTVGYAYVYGADPRYPRIQPVRWDAGSIDAIPLAPLISADGGKSSSSNAYAINSAGTIAGTADALDKYGNSLGSKAIIWRPDGVAVDLNTRLAAVGVTDPTWTLLRATAISDTGFVSGTGFYDLDGAAFGNDRYLRHFSLLVPEAGTYGTGDANLDTHANFDDLLLLAKHYGQANGTNAINVGDLDLNGVTNFDDLLTLAKHYEAAPTTDVGALGEAFASEWALAQSLVPEPGSLAAFVVCTLAASRRRPTRVTE